MIEFDGVLQEVMEKTLNEWVEWLKALPRRPGGNLKQGLLSALREGVPYAGWYWVRVGGGYIQQRMRFFERDYRAPAVILLQESTGLRKPVSEWAFERDGEEPCYVAGFALTIQRLIRAAKTGYKVHDSTWEICDSGE